MIGGEDTPERVGVALRLYVAADSAPSTLARRQLELVRERLGGVDLGGRGCGVLECPEVAEADGIVAMPVLVRLYPAPKAEWNGQPRCAGLSSSVRIVWTACAALAALALGDER